MLTKPSQWPAGYGLHRRTEVDSTLNEAARIAPGLTMPTWILADHQSAARGRRGRAWIAPKGNLAATLVMRPQGSIDQIALRSFVAALALFDALVAVSGRADGLALKWPNDVLLNGGKLAGILLESAGQGGGAEYLAVGIGVNLAQAPRPDDVEERAVHPVSLLSETGTAIGTEDFLTELASAYAFHEERFVTYGFEPTRTTWLSRAARLGEVITARTGTQETTGTFETVDVAGNLVLRTTKGRASIPAAEIYF
ncbi:MAG: biotin--[acetyl-CoA-carboxylase] ligase [Paracoccaceae bacterium]